MKCLFLIAILSLPLSTSIAIAQQQPLPPLAAHNLRDFADARPTNCAERDAVLDGITQKTPADKLLIVIARLGDGETRANLNQRRLHNVRDYWTEFLPAGYRRQAETIILAEGQQVRGYGQLEFYVEGNLVWVTKLPNNADLQVGECYPPDDSYIRNHRFNPCEVKSNKIFYPCRAENVPRKSRR
jgi:hypothetical protein